MATRITNTDTLDPGTLVRAAKNGKVIYEVIETRKLGKFLEGRLRHTVTGRSVGWYYLDLMVCIELVGGAPEEAHVIAAAKALWKHRGGTNEKWAESTAPDDWTDEALTVLAEARVVLDAAAGAR